MIAAVSIPSKRRVKRNWYTKISPLFRENKGLTPLIILEENY